MTEESKFTLKPYENEKWFLNHILPRYLDNTATRSKYPTFTLLTGQPGAGKTTISHKYASIQDEASIVFGADDLRVLHPRAREILEYDEANFALHTKKDVAIWRQRLVQEAIKNKRNVLVESILTKSTDWDLDTFRAARSAKYCVECVALGVHHFFSTLGLFYRYEMEKKEKDFVASPRLLLPHHLSYEILPQNCANMLIHKTIDNLKVINRNLDVFYDSGFIFSEGDVLSAVNKARHSTFQTETIEGVCKSWNEIFKLMDARETTPQEREDVVYCAASFLKFSELYFNRQLSEREQVIIQRRKMIMQGHINDFLFTRV